MWKNALIWIANGDTILTYARSHVVEEILKSAMRKNRDFKVVHSSDIRYRYLINGMILCRVNCAGVVCDSRPKCEGLHLLKRLIKEDIRLAADKSEILSTECTLLCYVGCYKRFATFANVPGHKALEWIQKIRELQAIAQLNQLSEFFWGHRLC